MVNVEFTIATLVNNHSEYELMRDTFVARGFGDDCEFLILDNSETNIYDGYSGYNAVLQRARGTFVILCHQDVRLDFDDRDVLTTRLAELDERDPTWAVVGNAGGLDNGSLAIRISDPWGDDRRVGVFPSRVCSLDSNFIVVKNQTRLAFSNDLHGFHFYGSDICMQAEMRGFSAYVIDFHLRHLSPGNRGPAFLEARARFVAKWEHAMRRRFLRTTADCLMLEGGSVANYRGLTTSRSLIDQAMLLYKYGGRAREIYRLVLVGITARRRARRRLSSAVVP
jgi:hypothetical protein